MFHAYRRTAAILSVILASAATVAAQSQTAVNRAHGFLAAPSTGRLVIGYAHFGAEYRGHEYVRTAGIRGGKPGSFALIYRFRWHSDGASEIAFLCNQRGDVYEARVLETNAVWSQPFAMANAAVTMLGNALLDRFGERLSATHRQMIRELIDRADSKGLLEWSLSLNQP